MKKAPLAPLFASLLFAASALAEAPNNKLMEMPDRPSTPEALQAQQDAGTRKIQATLAKFDAIYAGKIRLERVHFPTVDGHQAPAYIFTDAKLDPSMKHPAIVFVRESAHGQFLEGYFRFVEEAVRRGYVLIFPEIRGSIGYGLAYYQDLDIAGKEIDDVLSGTDYLVSHVPSVDSHRLAVMGISHGGTMVLYALETAPDRFRAGVDIVGPTSLSAYLSRRTRPADQAEFYGQPSLAGAKEHPEILEQKSPLAHVDRIKSALLVLSVTNDFWTPVAMHPAPLVAALNAAGVGYEFHLIKDAPDGHLFFISHTRTALDAQDDVFTFIGRAVR